MTAGDIAIKRIGHVALFVADPEASAQWYSEILGMTVVARAGAGPYQGGIFLSFGLSDHDLGLFRQRRGATKGKEFEHIGLEMDCGGDLGALQRFHARLVGRGVRIQEILDHGVSKGIYFFDPDGHLLEVFCQQIAGPEAIAELGRNGGMARPFDLFPVSTSHSGEAHGQHDLGRHGEPGNHPQQR